MELINLKILKKHLSKNKRNLRLRREVVKLISLLREDDFNSYQEQKKVRKDADNVFEEVAFLFNIHSHRTLVQIEFNAQIAKFLWAGNHDKYDRYFKGDKKAIKDLVK